MATRSVFNSCSRVHLLLLLLQRFLKFAMLKVAFLAVVRSPGYGGVMQASVGTGPACCLPGALPLLPAKNSAAVHTSRGRSFLSPLPLQWLAWCAVICWFSMFTKLASLRGDALLSSPSATLAQHLRILLLLGGILAQDLSWVAGFLRTARGMQGGSLRWVAIARPLCCVPLICDRLFVCGSWSAFHRSAVLPAPCSHALLWLFDATFVAVDAAYALLKYAVQAWDHCKVMRAEVRGEVSFWFAWGSDPTCAAVQDVSNAAQLLDLVEPP